MRPATLLALLLFLAIASSLKGEQTPLQQTQNTLIDPVQRQKAIGSSPSAQSADSSVQQLTASPAQTQKVYELASKVMGDLVQHTKGDPKQMESVLENAKNNPEAFANTFTPEEKKMLNDISQNIPAKMP